MVQKVTAGKRLYSCLGCLKASAARTLLTQHYPRDTRMLNRIHLGVENWLNTCEKLDKNSVGFVVEIWLRFKPVCQGKCQSSVVGRCPTFLSTPWRLSQAIAFEFA
ncbi:hypothetical protein CEXT_76111 [Caerostris extrusa]|uniref:Uncharacterized protein n=1 Tax=Caerostris extrusa TaxID=172846 RepID=A0AAV4WBS8_CAEEX|nr:hypothetical protein CEXT_76111 [Caerostris extrusa]